VFKSREYKINLTADVFNSKETDITADVFKSREYETNLTARHV